MNSDLFETYVYHVTAPCLCVCVFFALTFLLLRIVKINNSRDTERVTFLYTLKSRSDNFSKIMSVSEMLLIFMSLNNLIYFYFSICNLYKWRYKRLGNLVHVENWPEYRVANPGFWFDFQVINVEDFNGVGESEPSPYFYQVSITSLSSQFTI